MKQGALMKKYTRGIGLLELMLSLAIIAILLVMATRYYSATTKSQRVDDTIQLLGELETAVNTQIANDGTEYIKINLADLVSNGYLSAGRVTGGATEPKLKNPWGGEAGFLHESADVKVTLENVPAQQCKDLSKKFFGGDGTSGCTSGQGTVTFTYLIK